MNFGDIFGTVFDAVKPIVKDLAESYVQKDKNTDNLTWLTGELMKKLPDEMQIDTASEIGQEILGTINKFNENMTSIEKYAEEEKTKEQWLKDQVMNNKELSLQEKGEYLEQAAQVLSAGNIIMTKMLEKPQEVKVNEEIENLAKALENQNAKSEEKYNKFNITPVMQNVSLNMEMIGANGMALASELGQVIEEKQEEPIFEEDMLDSDRGDELDNNLKMIAATALKVGVEAGKVPFLSKVLPVSAITNVACVGVEAVKSIGNVATGKISPLKAIENVGRATVAATADFIASGLPAKLLAPIPVIGPALSVAVGGALASISSKKIQKVIYKGVEKVKEATTKAVEAVKSIGTKVKETAKELFGSFMSIFS